jgi:hypothetical protein
MTDDLKERLEAMSTGELVTILRERGRGGWRPEVFPLVESILGGRNVDASAIAPEVPSEMAFAHLQTVGTFSTAIEANLAHMALTQAGIESTLSGEHMAGVHAPLGMTLGVGVLVAPENADAAREILEEIRLGRPSGPGEHERKDDE